MKLTDEQSEIGALKLGILSNFQYFTGEEKAKEAAKIVEKLESTIEAQQQEIEMLKNENISIKNWNACEEEQYRKLLESDKRRIELEEENEAQQQEIEGWQKKYEELDTGHSKLFGDFCKQQIEQKAVLEDDDIQLSYSTTRLKIRRDVREMARLNDKKGAVIENIEVQQWATNNITGYMVQDGDGRICRYNDVDMVYWTKAGAEEHRKRADEVHGFTEPWHRVAEVAMSADISVDGYHSPADVAEIEQLKNILSRLGGLLKGANVYSKGFSINFAIEDVLAAINKAGGGVK